MQVLEAYRPKRIKAASRDRRLVLTLHIFHDIGQLGLPFYGFPPLVGVRIGKQNVFTLARQHPPLFFQHPQHPQQIVEKHLKSSRRVGWVEKVMGGAAPMKLEKVMIQLGVHFDLRKQI